MRSQSARVRVVLFVVMVPPVSDVDYLIPAVPFFVDEIRRLPHLSVYDSRGRLKTPPSKLRLLLPFWLPFTIFAGLRLLWQWYRRGNALSPYVKYLFVK